MSASSSLEPPDGFALALNALPLVLLMALAALSMGLVDGGWSRAGMFVFQLYLVPPLLGRGLMRVFGVPNGVFTQDDRRFRVWWALLQLQMVFNRLPMLEEMLRLVPGLYPLWIALWGGHLSARAFVGPAVVLTDRTHLEVRQGAVLGYRSALAAHMVTRTPEGRWSVTLAAPIVEEDAILGGSAEMGPGARLLSGAQLPAGRRLGPFGTWPRSASAHHPAVTTEGPTV